MESLKNDKEIATKMVFGLGFLCGQIGSGEQNLLSKAGDDIRIDWGYFYLSASEGGRVCVTESLQVLF